jgi:hypothetical protein
MCDVESSSFAYISYKMKYLQTEARKHRSKKLLYRSYTQFKINKNNQ